MLKIENTNQNFIIVVLIVICSGLMGSLLSAGFNIGIIIQILQYLTIWAVIVIISATIFHYAPLRADFQIKRFSIYIGFCFIPFLIHNIIKPLLGRNITVHLDGVWDVDVIRQATGNWLFHAEVFLYAFLPAITICAVIVLVAISINRVYDVSAEKALLISIPLVFFASFMATVIQQWLLMVF
jgi:hypothetical protein